MSDIVRARAELFDLASRLDLRGDADLANEIRNIVQERLFRRAAVRRMPVKSRRLTPVVKDQIRTLAAATTLHSSDIAAAVQVNPGRVSEVLHGDR